MVDPVMGRVVIPIVLCVALFGSIEVSGWSVFRAFVNSDPQSMSQFIATRISAIPESSWLLVMGVGLVLVSRTLRRRNVIV